MNQKLFKVLGLMLILAMAFSLLTACGGKEATKASTEGEAGETTGQPGPAIDLTGDAVAGAVIFKDKCAECHGEEGKGGVKNAGAEEPIVPGLNPLDPEFVSTDAKEFATKIDLFLEHGATPEGTNVEKVMKAFGDDKLLTPQQIADVIAYVIRLNQK